MGISGGGAGGDAMTFRKALWAGALLAASLVAAVAAERLPGETFRDCDDCPEMVVAPAGDFTMGSTQKPSEQPPHIVTLRKAFAIGRREITFAEWDRCVTTGGCNYTPPDQGWGRGDRPAINLSWADAKQYVAWLSIQTGKTYRLPTEAEWEYSARGGAVTPFWWGKEVGSGRAKCADCGDKTPRTVPVGSFRPNAFGLYDTAGNAAEWVEDCWSPSYKGAPADGSAWTTGDCSLRVLRGGSFLDKAAGVSSSARFRYDNDVRYYANGFRPARDVN
jgi:formylglycine-generating enzyme required for sulfatase activity